MTLGHDDPDTDTLWLCDWVSLKVLQIVGEVVPEEEDEPEREPDGEKVPVTLGQEDTLTVPLALADTVPDREPLSVPVPQAEADCDSLVLGVSVPDALEQPEDVADAQLLAETEELEKWLMVPLTVPLTVLVKLAVEQADTEPDMLTLGLMVLDTVVQPLLVTKGELEEDTLGLPDGQVVPLLNMETV